MKIGVVSNLDNSNYGSILQAYSLSNKLSEYGHDVEYIKYKKHKKKKILPSLKTNGNHYSLKSRVEIKLARNFYKNKIIKNNKFLTDNISIRHFNEYNDLCLISDQYPLILAGSDQIWSPRAGLLSDYTLLNFCNSKTIRASYATSIGVNELDDNSKKKILDALNNYLLISIREDKFSDEFTKKLGKEVQVSVDPTLLYDSCFWNEKIKTVSTKTKDEYIFVYMLRPEKTTLEMALKLSKETGLKIKLCSNRIIKNKKIENITTLGVEEFLSHIKNAKYVITNSFHGSVFSIIFNKKFITTYIEGSGIRTKELLFKLKLEKRLATKSSDLKNIHIKTNWTEVEKILLKLRKESIKYIESILSHVHETKDVLSDHEKCTGCSACINACPKQCISMVPDEYGFNYPKINLDECIKCGLCKKTCPVLNKSNTTKEPIKCYASISKDKSNLKSSSSGGLFYEIANYIIKNDGIVVGVSLEKNNGKFEAKHIIVDNKEELEKLKGSKYVQSSINDIFKRTEKFLKDDKLVLFTGTPCQISGLKKYLKKEYNKLFLLEIMCHGVPNNQMFNEFISRLKNHEYISNYEFRNKKNGWLLKTSKISYKKEDRQFKKYLLGYKQSYYMLFLDSYILRESCYDCSFVGPERNSDITIGDYWGIDEEHKKELKKGIFNKKDGVSCVLVNSEKGLNLLNKLKKNIILVDTSINKIKKRQSTLRKVNKRPKDRNNLMEKYKRNGYNSLEKFYQKKYKKKKMTLYFKKKFREAFKQLSRIKKIRKS